MSPRWKTTTATALIAAAIAAMTLPHAADAGLFTKKESYEAVDLMDYNFDEQTKEGNWLVMFHAPWCGHCKRFGPVLDEAARDYFGGDIRVGKVDATVNKKLKARFDVSSFPRVRYFEDGKPVTEYRSGRDLASVLAFGERMLAKPLRPFDTPRDLHVWMTESSSERDPTLDPVSFVVLGKEDDPREEIVAEAARALRPSVLFAKCQSEACWTSFCQLTPTPSFCSEKSPAEDLVLVRFEAQEPVVAYDGDLGDVEAIKTWANSQNVPTFTELGAHNYGMLANQPGRLLLLGAVNTDHRKNTTQFLLKLRKLARGQSDSLPKDVLARFVIAHIDGKQWGPFLEDYNLFLEELPRVLIIDTENDCFYEDVEQETDLEGFLAKVARGEAEAQSSGMILSVKRMWRMFLRSMPMSGVIFFLVLLVFIMFTYMLCISEFEMPGDHIAELVEAERAELAAAKAGAPKPEAKKEK